MFFFSRGKEPATLLAGAGNFLDERRVAHANLQDSAADVLWLAEPLLVHLQNRLQAVRRERNESDALELVILRHEVQADRSLLIDSRHRRAQRQSQQLA